MFDATTAFTYRAYGLTFASELSIPELTSASGDADVTVRIGPVAAHPARPTTSGVLFEASKDAYTLHVDGVARYHARCGREVTIDIAPAATDADVRLFLLTSVMTALLHQRAALVLHASSVVGPQGAVLIAGHSGHGKSTLAAALAARGCAVLADDASAVIQDSRGRLLVPPAFAQVKLWRDMVKRLGHSPDRLTRTRPTLEKFTVPLPGPATADAPVLSRIVVLTLSSEDGVRLESVADGDRLDMIRAVTRNRMVAEALQMQVPHFRLAAAIAAAVPLWRLTRPSLRDSLDEVVDAVESVIA